MRAKILLIAIVILISISPALAQEKISVWRTGEELPRIENWYAGDIHYHTNYSKNPLEDGGLIEETKIAAKEIGLDFITITDHSFALRDWQWPQLIRLASKNSDNKFLFIPGEEVSTVGGIERYKHFLAIGIENYIPGEEIESYMRTKTLSPGEVVENVNSQGGAGYVAHPFYQDPFRKQWKEPDYNLPFTGLQVWNYETWMKDQPELEKGIQKWQELLAKGRRVFIGGGSDSHGNFMTLGKARTYVYTKDFSQSGILQTLKEGNSFITDGPLIAVWINGATFGQEALVEKGQKARINFQFTSNLDIGKVTEIEIWNGENIEEILRPGKYFESGFEWESKFSATDTYYRFIARTENGYTAYTNPIWVRTFTKPAAPVVIKQVVKDENKEPAIITPLIIFPSIIIKPQFSAVHKLDPRQIIESYKTNEMRKIDKITSGALKKMNNGNGTSVFQEKFAKNGQISGNEQDENEKEYSVERHGGKVYYPD